MAFGRGAPGFIFAADDAPVPSLHSFLEAHKPWAPRGASKRQTSTPSIALITVAPILGSEYRLLIQIQRFLSTEAGLPPGQRIQDNAWSGLAVRLGILNPIRRFILSLREPVQEEWIHEQRLGFVSRLSIGRIIARPTNDATDVATRWKSRARRRLRLIHANVCSTIQRVGKTTKP